MNTFHSTFTLGSLPIEGCRCLGGSRQASLTSSSSRSSNTGSDTRSVATQTFVPALLVACPRPTPHRRLFAAVRPQSAPLEEEEEEEDGEYDVENDDGVEVPQKETQVASSWGAHQEPPSPTMVEAAADVGAAKDRLRLCCHFCQSRSSLGRPHSPLQDSSLSSSVFVFGDEMLGKQLHFALSRLSGTSREQFSGLLSCLFLVPTNYFRVGYS